MKKLLSFTLVAIMLFSALMLTSCDPIESVKDIYNKVIGKEESTKEIRTTVTATELRYIYKITNHTTKANLGDVKLNVVAADTLMKMDLYMIGSGNTTTYYDLDASVIVTKDVEMGWIGYVSDTVSVVGNTKLGDLNLLPEVMLDDLIYNEETKSYTYEEDGTELTLKFEEGKLIYAHMTLDGYGSNGEVEISNVGTTVVEIPKHAVVNDGKPDKNLAADGVVTTITEEDLRNLFSMTNFTFDGKIMTDLGVWIDVSFKLNDAGLEISSSALGTYEKQYIIVIDGYLYSISKDENGKYIALNTGANVSELEEQLDLIRQNIVMDIPYDLMGRYYKVETEEISLYLYFADGQLTKAVMLMDAEFIDPTQTLFSGNKVEISFVLTDVNKTNIYIPKYEIPQNELEFELNGEGTGYVVMGIGSYNGTDIVIPDTYKGLPVVAIGANAFTYKNITSVVVPDTVKEINYEAFYGCKQLTSVTLPDTLIYVGEYAFYYCNSLTQIEIPASVEYMGYGVFAGCHNITVYCDKEYQPSAWDEMWHFLELNSELGREVYVPVYFAGVKLPDEVTPDAPDDDPYTVITDVWNANMTMTNYTANILLYGGTTGTVWQSGNVLLIELISEDETIREYEVCQNSVIYCVAEQDGIWYGTPEEMEEMPNWTGFFSPITDKTYFEYDSELQAYVSLNGSFEHIVKFENDILVSYKINVISSDEIYIAFDFSEVGTTAEVVAPKFTIVE